VGRSKTYLQLTHTACLTKHKPKGNEERQKREAKTGYALKKKKTKQWSDLLLLLFSSNEVCKIYDEEICRLLRRRQ
jgi:hypothetical protein